MFNSNKKSFPNSLSDIHLAFMPFDLFKSDIAVKTSFVQKGQIDGLTLIVEKNFKMQSLK